MKRKKQLKAMARTEFWAWLEFRHPQEWKKLMIEFTFNIRPSGEFTQQEFVSGLDPWHIKNYPERRVWLFAAWVAEQHPPQCSKEDIAEAEGMMLAVC